MADDWESIAENENVVIPTNINKWEGEDEDDDVKESWEEEEEEKKDEEKPKEELNQNQVKQKKTKDNKSYDKEKHKIDEDKLEQERLANMTPEEKLAEKLRLQKIQEEEDLKVAMETFGVTGSSAIGLDAFHPTNRAEFLEYAEALSKRISLYKNADDFPVFIEELIRNICAALNMAELKKVKLTVENLHLEKQKLEKEKTKKASGKGKSKIKLRVEEDTVRANNIGDYGYDYDYDDFM